MDGETALQVMWIANLIGGAASLLGRARGIDWFAHLGGMAVGWAWFHYRARKAVKSRRRRSSGW